jgi:hypothetical protein
MTTFNRPRIIDALPTAARLELFDALRAAYDEIKDDIPLGMERFDIIEEIINDAEFFEKYPKADDILQHMIYRYGYKDVFKQLSLTFTF